jgi:hypothetical protein
VQDTSDNNCTRWSPEIYCNYKCQFVYDERLQSTNKSVMNTGLPAVTRTVLRVNLMAFQTVQAYDSSFSARYHFCLIVHSDWINSAGILSVSSDLNLFSLSIPTSTSCGSAVRISVCLTSLTPWSNSAAYSKSSRDHTKCGSPCNSYISLSGLQFTGTLLCLTYVSTHCIWSLQVASYLQQY